MTRSVSGELKGLVKPQVALGSSSGSWMLKTSLVGSKERSIRIRVWRRRLDLWACHACELTVEVVAVRRCRGLHIGTTFFGGGALWVIFHKLPLCINWPLSFFSSSWYRWIVMKKESETR